MSASLVWIIWHEITKWRGQAVGERQWEAREKDYACMTTDEELAAKKTRLNQIMSGAVEPLVRRERFELELYIDNIDLFRV
jgi:hypothetical protein